MTLSTIEEGAVTPDRRQLAQQQRNAATTRGKRPTDRAARCIFIMLHILELALAAGLFYGCLVVVVSKEPSWFSTNAALAVGSQYHYRSIKMLFTAIMTAAALLVLMNELLRPIISLLAMLVVPLSSLAYPAFLAQTIVVYAFCQSLGSASDVSFTWSGGFSSYTILFFELLLADVVVALFIALLVERPIYRLWSDRSN